MTTASTRWHPQLAFRNALRADPDLLRAYAQLKRNLARLHPTDRDAYTAGKQHFVQDVLGRVDLTPSDSPAPGTPPSRPT